MRSHAVIWTLDQITFIILVNRHYLTAGKKELLIRRLFIFSSVLLPLLFFSFIPNSQPMTLLPTSVRKWKHLEENFHRSPSPHLVSCRQSIVGTYLLYFPVIVGYFFPFLFIKLVHLLVYYIAFCLSYSGSFLQHSLFSLSNIGNYFTLSYIILITTKRCC